MAIIIILIFYIINTKLMPIIILENLIKLITPYRYLGRYVPIGPRYQTHQYININT